MAAALLLDPDDLRCRLKELLDPTRSSEQPGRQDDARLAEAIAEASLRLALNPSTPPAEAFELLFRAVRLDGTNPRNAYHLGRLYMSYGQFKQAAVWMKEAARQAPTSHRIWTHISILQRELNAAYRGKNDYEPDALLKRSEEIAGSVIAGKDVFQASLADFAPPISRARKEEIKRQTARQEIPIPPAFPTPAAETFSGSREAFPKRYEDPNQCRWSGIRDLTAEWYLEGLPTQKNMTRLLPMLAQAANQSRQRGTPAAFAILGIQWILSGYPVEPVREQRKAAYAEQTGPALQLLDRVCDLYEADGQDLPALLADALDSGEIPAVLAALIHQRRLLPAPVEFRNTGLYLRAKRFLIKTKAADPVDEKERDARIHVAGELAHRLENAIAVLQTEQAAAGMSKKDSAVGSANLTDGSRVQPAATDLLRDLAQEAEDIRVHLEKHWTELKELVVIHHTQGLSDEQIVVASGIDQYAQAAFAACERALMEIENIRSHGQMTAEMIVQLDHSEQLFRNHLTRRGPYLKNLLKLPKSPAETGFHADTSARKSELPKNPAEPARLPAEVPTSGIELLEDKLKSLETGIIALFQRAKDTFSAYSLHTGRLAPLQELYLTICAQEAEAYFRLGWHRQARQVWNAMLGIDRLDTNIMKNIALCDSREAELSASLSAWRNYAEYLYLLDIVEGDPHPHILPRIELHRAFADAYGPATWPGKLDQAWVRKVDKNDILAFFTSPGRVQNFVDHKLLEYLNKKLDFKSPSLILGISRSEGIHMQGNNPRQDDASSRREVAPVSTPAQIMVRFASESSPVLPERLRSSFLALSRQVIGKAEDEVLTSRRGDFRRDQKYADEEPRQAAWIEEIVELKLKFRLLVQDANFTDDLVQHVDSLDWLSEMQRLDAIPLDGSETFAKPVMQRFQVEKPSELNELMNQFGETVVSGLLKFIFTDGIGSDESLRKQQYRRLVTDWIHSPALQPYLEMIDDPQSFYLKDLEDLPTPAQRIAEMREWNTRYPELSGPGRYLAFLLIQEKDYRQAISTIDRVVQTGFYQAARPSLHFMRMQAWYSIAENALRQNQNELLPGAVEKMCRDAELVLQESSDDEEKRAAWHYRTVECANLYLQVGKYDQAWQAILARSADEYHPDERANVLLIRAQSLFALAAEDERARRMTDARAKLVQASEEAGKALAESTEAAILLDEAGKEKLGILAEEARKLISEIDKRLDVPKTG